MILYISTLHINSRENYGTIEVGNISVISVLRFLQESESEPPTLSPSLSVSLPMLDYSTLSKEELGRHLNLEISHLSFGTEEETEGPVDSSTLPSPEKRQTISDSLFPTEKKCFRCWFATRDRSELSRYLTYSSMVPRYYMISR